MTAADRWHTLADAETALTLCEHGNPADAWTLHGTPCPCPPRRPLGGSDCRVNGPDG